MKILLVNPMFNFFEKPRAKSHFPFGIAFLAQHLLEHGHQVEILDILGEVLDRAAVEQRIRAGQWDLIGVSAISVQYLYVKNFVTLCKKIWPQTPVVVGGVLPTYNFREVLNNTLADFCVIGHGWQPLQQLLANGLRPENISGLAYKDASGQIVFQAPEKLPKVVFYPRPAYELFNMNKYFGGELAVHKEKDKKVAPLITGFGCPYQCGFCSKLDSNYSYRDINNLINEVRFLKEKYQITGVNLLDECLFINPEHLREFCVAMKELGLIWSAQARVNLVSGEIIKMVKDAGCVCLGYGIESGSQKLLNAMKKAQTIEQIETAVKLSAQAGIDVKVQLLLGYPGEDRQTIKETIALFDRLAYPPRRFLILLPLPGSAVYRDLLAAGRIKDEHQYLSAISSGLYGVSPKKVFLNCTGFSDRALLKIREDAQAIMKKNYYRHILRGDTIDQPPHVRKIYLWFSYLPDFVYCRLDRLIDKLRQRKKGKKGKLNSALRRQYYFWDLPDPAKDLKL